MATAKFSHLKKSTLAALSAEHKWTNKRSLKLPSLWEFVVGIITRQRGGFKFDERRRLARSLSSPDFLVISLLSTAYFFSVFSRVSVSVLAPELQVDPDLSYNSQKHGQVVIAVQLCFMIGRLVNGFLIDLANPRYMLMGYMIGSSAVTFLMSSVHTVIPDKDTRFNFILGCAATNACFQSGTWLAATKFIHDHFRPAQYGKAIVVLSVMAKMGSVGAILSLSGLIANAHVYWIDAQRFASGLTLAGILFLLATFLFPHPAGHLAAKSAEDHHLRKFDIDAPAPSQEQVEPHGFRCSREIWRYRAAFARAALLRWLSWWTKKQFVLVAIANASMAIVCSTEGLEAFLTLFFFNGIRVPSKVASQAAIVLPLGVTVSLLFGGAVLERLDKPSKADGVLLMLLLAVFATVALLGVTSGVESTFAKDPTADAGGYLVGVIITIFFMGAFMGYSFFVPISTFALTFGGEHAALASATLNVFSSCIGAAFSASVGSLAATSWTSVMGIVLAFAILALLAMTLYYYYELVDKRKALAEAKSVIANLQDLVLHKPHFEGTNTSNPKFESSFFRHETTSSDKQVLVMRVGDDASDDTPASVPDDEAQKSAKVEEKDSATSLQNLTIHERWAHLRKIYGPSLRHDANAKVERKIAIAFSIGFVIFGFAMFISYFVARSDPNFVFPFGDGVRYANRTI